MVGEWQMSLKVCDIFFFFLYIPIRYYNTYLRSTILTIITLQYYWDEHPRGAKGHVYPEGINIDKRQNKNNLNCLWYVSLPEIWERILEISDKYNIILW